MSDSKAARSMDFAGFLDGFQARNLAAIERNTALQLAELQTRLRVLQAELARDSSAHVAHTGIAEAERSLRDPSANVVVRLTNLSKLLQAILLQSAPIVLSGETRADQFKWIVQRYVEAAEISHSDALVDAAVKLGQVYQDAAQHAA
jgi:hypothetical protein